VSGGSHLTGQPGGQRTTTRLSIKDISVGGTTFSIADDQLVLAGESIPLTAPPAQAFFDTVNASLATSGCKVAAAASPNRYPQGFLFSRQEPRVGTDPNGTFAASYRAGLAVLCDLPAAVTDNAQVGDVVFSPQRVQILLGWVYTSTTATTEPGGFGLGDLATPSLPPLTGGAATAAPTAIVPDLSAAATPAAAAPSRRAAAATSNRPAPFLRFGPMDGTTRWVLGVVALAAWTTLTHLGLRRLRGVLGE
jgi:hypothetical protein